MAQRRGLAPVPAPKPPAIGIAAAGRRVDIEAKEADGYRHKAKSETWQREAFTYFDILGEVKQPTYFLANTCSLARLYVAVQPDPEQDPDAAPDGIPGSFEANDALERLRTGARGGLSGIIRNFTVNTKIAGECWLVGIPEQPAIEPGVDKNFPEGRDEQPERWAVYSVSQIESKGEGRGQRYTFKDHPSESDGKAFPPDSDVIRMWQEHPEFPELADCAMRALLSTCEELLILSRMVKAAGRSRLATAGILVMASELDPTPAPQPGAEADGAGNDDKPFIETLMEAAEANIAQEGTAAAAVPIVVKGPHALIKDGIFHIDFSRSLDPLALEQRKELIQRMGQGSDVPMEILVGLRQVNHWTAFQVDQSTWDRYGHPSMRLLCESLTAGFLRPVMEAAGVDPSVASRFLVWFDPAGAVAQPDRTQTIMDSLDRFLISWDTARTILSFADSDAPTDEEIARRVEIAVAMKAGASPDGGAGPAGDGAPNDGIPPSSPTESADPLVALHRFMQLNGGRLPPALAAAAAKRRQPLGRRLMQIDRTLRTRLIEASDAALLRALERAGARVRNRAKKNAHLAAVVAKLAAWEVPARLGAEGIQRLGFTDGELLADGFDDLQPKFLDRVAKAQDEALDAMAADLDLDESEIDSIRVAQQRDRNDAWTWLAGALLSLGLSRLYSPKPEAPPRGEFDASVSVPTGLIREAMARAGGAGGAETVSGAPAGGVALGQLVLDTFARHGQATRGWEWVYGDPSSRTNPFEPHAGLDGESFETWHDAILAWQGGDEWLDGDGFYKPGDHSGCFPAGVEVSGPLPRGATLRRYEGDLVEVTLASGQLLSATPNHPVLTRRGWVPAGFLEEGDEVVRCSTADGVAGLVPDDRQVPALIEDVVATFGVSPGVVARAVPVTAEHFHGDGVGSEVAVVWTDGQLSNGVDSTLAQPSTKQPLFAGDADSALLSSKSGSTERVEGIGSTALGGMGGGGVAAPRGGTHPLGSDELRVAGATSHDALHVEPLRDGVAVDAETLCESQDRFAAFIESDKVLTVNRHAFAGDVYNLDTGVGWYIANGIVVHNCQCDFVALGLGSDESADAETVGAEA